MSVVADSLRDAERRRSFKLTEMGNGDRFAVMHGDRLRYVKAWGAWLVWDGRRWRRDDVGAEMVAAKEVVGAIYSEAAEASKLAALGDDEAGGRAKELTRWAKASSKANAIRAMVTLAQCATPIAATAQMFDRDPWLLNCSNGTLDLRDATLRQHRPGDMLTMLAPVDFDPDAIAPTWDRFLARSLPDDGVRSWVQRYMGYALTGDVSEQVLSFFYGSGANGKSVLLDVQLAMLGDYGLRAAPDLVLAKHGEGHPTELADLDGKRLVVASEIEQGRAWSESTIKRITGDTTITARRMRSDFYTFTATHKLVIAANTKPTVRGTDHAIWRRMRLVPFEVTIPEGERDKGLVAKLLAERSGVLAWAVRGCLDWRKNGLGEAAAMSAATESYRADQDVLGHFIDEECFISGDVFVAMSALYDAYTKWCERTGRDAWDRDTVRSRLLDRGGITSVRRDHGRVRGLAGIALRSDRAAHLEVVR